MVEFYKEISRFRADIKHESSGQMIDYEAVVYEGPQEGRFSIRHSHTFKSNEGAGFWFSNSHTSADSPDDAEDTVRAWANMISTSYEVRPWVNLHGGE